MITSSLGVRATTQAADDFGHAVYDTGPYGILTLCGQIGTTPMRRGAFDCPVCLERASRDDVGIWFDGMTSMRTWRIDDQR